MFKTSWAESKAKETSSNTYRGFFLKREISFGGIISCRNKSEQSFLGFVSLKSVHLPSRLVSHHAMWLWWVDWEDFQPRARSLIQFELTLIEHICAARKGREMLPGKTTPEFKRSQRTQPKPVTGWGCQHFVAQISLLFGMPPAIVHAPAQHGAGCCTDMSWIKIPGPRYTYSLRI